MFEAQMIENTGRSDPVGYDSSVEERLSGFFGQNVTWKNAILGIAGLAVFFWILHISLGYDDHSLQSAEWGLLKTKLMATGLGVWLCGAHGFSKRWTRNQKVLIISWYCALVGVVWIFAKVSTEIGQSDTKFAIHLWPLMVFPLSEAAMRIFLVDKRTSNSSSP